MSIASSSSVLPFSGDPSSSHRRAAGLLGSWKDISTYLSRGVRTVQRWELELGLPVHRTSGGKRAPVFAFEQEIDGWLQQRPGILSERCARIAPIRPPESVDQRNSMKANGGRVGNDHAQLNPRQQRLIESVRELSQNALALEQQVGTRVLGSSSDTTGSLVTFEQLTKAVISIQKIMDALLTVEKLLNTAVAQGQVGITPATNARAGGGATSRPESNGRSFSRV